MAAPLPTPSPERAPEDGIAPADAPVLRPLATAAVVFVLTGIYLYGVATAARRSLAFEVFVAFALPAACMGLGLTRSWSSPRIRELFLFESVYNLMVVVSKVGLAVGSHALNVAGSWGFFLFMFLQLGGFLRQVTKAGSRHGMVQTLLGITTLFVWWWGIADRASTIDADGRFLMWGEDTDLAFRIIYSFWAVNLVLGDSMYLPKLVQVAVQMASLALAWGSGEFFHVRMLTASHLFFLDGLFGLYGLHVVDRDFCVVPRPWQDVFRRRGRPAVNVACTVAIVAVFVWNVARRWHVG